MKPATRATLELLRDRPNGITQLQALSEIGTFRLAARVGELRAMGFRVETEWLATYSGKRVARYRLIENEPEQLAAGF